MRERLLRLSEAAELAVASSEGVIDESQVAPLRSTIHHLRIRLGYPTDVAVVAIAGGTGSGKSSLFNALIGSEIAAVGGVRPTTSVPMAAVPSSNGHAFNELLDALDIGTPHVYEGPGPCVIDLPDYDSVEVDHRLKVDQLLPLVDAVVWVTDPEKYRDARLHHEYLKPLSSQQSRFLIVLNQTDRLQDDEVEGVVADLNAALAEDGFAEPSALAISADPPNGPPRGIEAVRTALIEMASDRGVVSEKLIGDIEEIAASLEESFDSSLDFDERAATAVAGSSEAIASGDMAAGIDQLVGFLRQIAQEAGGPVGRQIEFLAAQVPRHVARIVGETMASPRRKRLWRKPDVPSPDRDSVEAGVNEAIIRPTRVHLARRARAVAELASLRVELGNPIS